MLIRAHPGDTMTRRCEGDLAEKNGNPEERKSHLPSGGDAGGQAGTGAPITPQNPGLELRPPRGPRATSSAGVVGGTRMSKGAALAPSVSPPVAEPGLRPGSREFRGLIETFFGGGRCFLLAKGRVALYVGLRSLGLRPGSKVLMPGYTCMVVPSAVQYAGLKPVYLDIDPGSYNLDPV